MEKEQSNTLKRHKETVFDPILGLGVDFGALKYDRNKMLAQNIE